MSWSMRMVEITGCVEGNGLEGSKVGRRESGLQAKP